MSFVLEEDKLNSIRRMTSKQQIIIYLHLLRISKNNNVDIVNNLKTISEQTKYSIPMIKDIINNLIIDNHITGKNNNETKLSKGIYSLGDTFDDGEDG